MELTESLEDLRTQIDAIDHQIVKLLFERMAFVEEVGKRKAANAKSKSFIRSGREATMVRNLIENAKEQYPAAAIATMWRMIIASSLNKEKALRISASATEKDRDCYWLAREYFGAFIPLTVHPTASQVIREVASGVVEVGVLSLPKAETEEAWWVQLASGENMPRVFARIPFVEDGSERYVVAIANVVPELTGHDVSLIVMETHKIVSRDRIIKVFAKQDINAKVLGTKQNNTQNKRYLLVEVSAYMTKEDPRLQAILMDLSEERIPSTIIGAYAAPVNTM